jgi:methyl-accepting chemotaxis protein
MNLLGHRKKEFVMKITIRRRILIIAMIPTIGLLIYSLLGIRNGMATLNHDKDMISLSELALHSSVLVHETQKERGRTAGFLGSSGQKWQTEIKTQRDLTNKKKLFLLTFLKGFRKDSYGETFEKLLDDSMTRLKKLDDVRNRISNLKMDVQDAIAYYSDMNNAFLKMISYIPAVVRNGEIAKKFLGLSNFLYVKEKGGIERAILSAAFTAGTFQDQKVFSDFISLVALQDVFIDNFLSIADKEHKQLFQQKSKDSSFKDVIQLRISAISWAKKIEVIAKLRSYLSYGGLIHTFKNYILRGNIKYKNNFQSRYPEAQKIIAEFKALEGLSPKDKEQIGIVEKTLAAYSTNLKIAESMKRRGASIAAVDSNIKIDSKPAIAAFQFLAEGGNFGIDSSQWFSKITKKLNLLKDIEDVLNNNLNTEVKSLYSAALVTFLFILASTILILSITGYLIVIDMKKRITQPINVIVNSLQDAVAQADLTRRIAINSKDELGDISNWFNKFFERVHDIVTKVKQSAGEISESTNKIESGSEAMSERSKEQASSVTETSATLEEFTSTVKQNSDNAVEANTSLEKFNREVQEMQGLIGKVTETMQEINDSSERIDNIINVINDISFQTNLLALNAAVEAARAGEAGRGFAVVAAEVRNLAQKTSESSKSIGEIVTSNVEATKKGKELVNQTSKLFNTILEVMKELSERTKQIAEGSKEQATGVEQINIAINHLEQMINQNVSQVDEFFDTGKQMNRNVNELHQLVALFNIDDSQVIQTKIEDREPIIINPTERGKTSDPETEIDDSFFRFDEGDMKEF